MTQPTEIKTTIGRRVLSRNNILTWEARRVTKMMRKLGIEAPDSDLAVRRIEIAQRKLQLGHERIEDLLRRQLRISTPGAGALARLSAGRRTLSTIDIAVTTGSAETFTQWWNEHTVTCDEPPLLAICPDHWIIRSGPNGWQEVIETTGGSPLASRLFIDYQDTNALQSTPNPAFPHQITAVARLRDGTPIGGLRHQIRNTATGFQMKCTAEFPAIALPSMIAGHRWHLACEFSNMIEQSNGTNSSGQQ